MQKFKTSDVKPFQFHDLSQTTNSETVEKFNFKSFEFETSEQKSSKQEAIRSERKFESKKNFKIDDVVRKSRGLSDQENQDYEQKVQDEVERRLKLHFEEAYQAGHEEGLRNGYEESTREHHVKLTQEFERFTGELLLAREKMDELLLSEKNKTLDFVKRFVKWVLIKEMNNKEYLSSLFEKLILEMNARRNLIVKVSRQHFEDVNSILPEVERHVGQLQNIRVEIVPELQGPGILLETQNGLIDGSQESIMKNIDKIFEQAHHNDHI